MQLNKQILRMAQLGCVFCLLGTVLADRPAVDENAELVSYAQDVYRRHGINIARSDIELKVGETWGRVLIIKLVSRTTTLSDDLLQAFLVGGAVSQHAKSPMDQIVVVAEVEFSNREAMVMRAGGECCENLYNNLMTVDIFTRDCLRMEQ
ncbi:MAG: hypothetical protein HQ508_02055 [Candidatus Marinimicrobia bacterium]|nr:hypothetical protein [Candidatus Neomarinimicrobiota bacterium]